MSLLSPLFSQINSNIMIAKFDFSVSFFSMVRSLRTNLPSLKCISANEQFILEYGNVSFFLIVTENGIALLQKNINDSGYWRVTQFNEIFTEVSALSELILHQVA